MLRTKHNFFAWLRAELGFHMRQRSAAGQARAVRAFMAAFGEFGNREFRAAFGLFRGDIKSRKYSADECSAPALAVALLAAQRAYRLEFSGAEIEAAAALCRGSAADCAISPSMILLEGAAMSVRSLAGTGVHALLRHGYQAAALHAELRKLFRALGVEAAAIAPDSSRAERRKAYAAGITFAGLEEAMADYMRDRLSEPSGRVMRLMRPLADAFVHDADGLLLDGGRTSVEIFSESRRWLRQWAAIDEAIKNLAEHEDYESNPIRQTAALLPSGLRKLKQRLGASVFSPDLLPYAPELEASLAARALWERGRDYEVTSRGVERINEFTGRADPRGGFPLLLQRALEIKENAAAETEMPLVAMSAADFARQYGRIAGLGSGLAGAAQELKAEFGVPVVPAAEESAARAEDLYFRDGRGRLAWLVARAEICSRRGEPLVVCMPHGEMAEDLAAYFARRHIPAAAVMHPGEEFLGDIAERAARGKKIIIVTRQVLEQADAALEAWHMPENPPQAVVFGRGLSRRDDLRISAMFGAGAAVRFVHALDSEWFERWRSRGLQLAFDRAGLLRHHGQSVRRLDALIRRTQERHQEQSSHMRAWWSLLDEAWQLRQRGVLEDMHAARQSPAFAARSAHEALEEAVRHIFSLADAEVLARELERVLHLRFARGDFKSCAAARNKPEYRARLAKRFLQYGSERLEAAETSPAMRQLLTELVPQFMLSGWSRALSAIGHIYRDAEAAAPHDPDALADAEVAANAAMSQTAEEARRELVQTLFFYLEHRRLLI